MIMTMTKEQFELLMAYIDSRIQEYAARDSWDGGLTESMRTFQIKQELCKVIVDETNIT